MKIGIISEFSLNTANFGNQLQAFALNRYLRNRNADDTVESIYLKQRKIKLTRVFYLEFAVKVVKKIAKKVLKKDAKNNGLYDFSKRKKRCLEFDRKYISMPLSPMGWNELCSSDYDAFVVGSDIVWCQLEYGISRIKFLDFSNQKKFKKISYAASFGKDYIPKQNLKHLKRYLESFDAISVRENSSVKMLNDIGITNAKYCLDPTLLITKDEWEKIAEKPQVEINGDFVFVYLLGKDKKQREDIKTFAKANNLKIVTVPHANEIYDEADNNFGDVRLDACSIENWIWMIANAKYVITDSFHGVAFSTIFNKCFIALKRTFDLDINNRLQDYLREIEQTDKQVDSKELIDISNIKWDYQKINDNIAVRRNSSIDYLNESLGVNSR